MVIKDVENKSCRLLKIAEIIHCIHKLKKFENNLNNDSNDNSDNNLNNDNVEVIKRILFIITKNFVFCCFIFVHFWNFNIMVIIIFTSIILNYEYHKSFLTMNFQSHPKELLFHF